MITLIPTPIGNPQDITVRAMRLFERAEMFLCEDTRHTKKLLRLLHTRYGMHAVSAPLYSFHEHNSAQRIEAMEDALRHQEVVFVSDAGMPAISDPGQQLVRWAQEHAVPYDVLPGATAVTTAYAASGFAAGVFLFFGFLPHHGKERTARIDEVLGCGYDAILYEAPHRLEKLLAVLASRAPDREIFAAKELTKRYQRYYRGRADQVHAQITAETIRGEWVVIIHGKKSTTKSLTFDALMRCDLPPKSKAKLLAAVSDRSVKAWYATLIEHS